MKKLSLNGIIIGNNAPVFLIAEAGVNHNGNLSIAKKMVDLAESVGVDAIKFQTFKTERLILKDTLKVDYQKNDDRDNETFYDMVKKYELTNTDFKIIREYCQKKGILFLSTPFDEISVNFLDTLGISAFKIGSGDMNNYPLLELICSKKKPILLSTGMSTLNDVKEAVDYIKGRDINDIVIMQCTTSYPTPYENVNLNVLDTYKKEFPELILGFSDHSLGIEASIGAVAKGVKVIEKHFTLDKDMDGPDHKASLNPKELKSWVNSIRNIEKALGSYEKKPTNEELEISKIARKSLIINEDLKRGSVIRKEHISIKRPGTGIPPTDYDKVIGRKITKNLKRNSLLKWKDIE